MWINVCDMRPLWPTVTSRATIEKIRPPASPFLESWAGHQSAAGPILSTGVHIAGNRLFMRYKGGLICFGDPFVPYSWSGSTAIAPDAAMSMKAALNALGGADTSEAVKALRSLRLQGAGAAGAVTGLFTLFDSDDEEKQCRAMLGIKALGEHAAAAVPGLIERMGKRQGFARKIVQEALANCGPASKEAVIEIGKDKPLEAIQLAVLMDDPVSAVGAALGLRQHKHAWMGNPFGEGAAYYPGLMEQIVQRFGRDDVAAAPLVIAELEKNRNPDRVDIALAGLLARMDPHQAAKHVLDLLIDRLERKKDAATVCTIAEIASVDARARKALAEKTGSGAFQGDWAANLFSKAAMASLPLRFPLPAE